MMDIVLRCCITTEVVSRIPRDFGNKKDIITRCLSSLFNSIKVAENEGFKVNLFIVDDSVTDEFLTHCKETIQKVPDNLTYYKTSPKGYKTSIMTMIGVAKNSYADYVFFVEDDYLFQETCIVEMLKTIPIAENRFGSKICLHPTDYPDRYKETTPTTLLIGSDRHWRTIDKTTGTFCIPRVALEKFTEELVSFSDYGLVPGINEDSTINKIYSAYPCISPIPSLAEHLQYKHTLSPFCNLL